MAATPAQRYLFAWVQYTADPFGDGGFWNWNVSLGESPNDGNSCVLAEHLSAIAFLSGSGSNDFLYPECGCPTHLRDFAWRNITRLAWRAGGGQAIFRELSDLDVLIAGLLAVYACKGLTRQSITVMERLPGPSELVKEDWLSGTWDAGSV